MNAVVEMRHDCALRAADVADGGRGLKREPDATTLYLPGMELRRDATTGAVSATRYYTHNGTTIAVCTPTKLSWTLADNRGTVTATVSDDDHER